MFMSGTRNVWVWFHRDLLRMFRIHVYIYIYIYIFRDIRRSKQKRVAVGGQVVSEPRTLRPANLSMIVITITICIIIHIHVLKLRYTQQPSGHLSPGHFVQSPLLRVRPTPHGLLFCRRNESIPRTDRNYSVLPITLVKSDQSTAFTGTTS